MKNALIENIIRLHATEIGAERIRRNLGLTEDSVEWCRSKIMEKCHHRSAWKELVCER